MPGWAAVCRLAALCSAALCLLSSKAPPRNCWKPRLSFDSPTWAHACGGLLAVLWGCQPAPCRLPPHPLVEALCLTLTHCALPHPDPPDLSLHCHPTLPCPAGAALQGRAGAHPAWRGAPACGRGGGGCWGQRHQQPGLLDHVGAGGGRGNGGGGRGTGRAPFTTLRAAGPQAGPRWWRVPPLPVCTLLPGARPLSRCTSQGIDFIPARHTG